MLSIKKYNALPDGIFDRGFTYKIKDKFYWIAIKTDNQWEVFYHNIYKQDDDLLKDGYKAFAEGMIRTVILCSNEVWKKYKLF